MILLYVTVLPVFKYLSKGPDETWYLTRLYHNDVIILLLK